MSKLTLIFLTLLIACVSCVKDVLEVRDIEEFEYSPSFSIPIGPLSYTLGEIMPADSLSDYKIPYYQLPDSVQRPIVLYHFDSATIAFFNPETGFATYFYQPVNFGNLSNEFDQVQSAMLKTIVHSKLPVSITLQGYLLNGAGDIIDSVNREGPVLIEAPEIPANGVITDPTDTTLYTHYYPSNMEYLMETESIIIDLFLDTYEAGTDTLHVYPWYGIDLQIGLRAELLIPVRP